MNYKLDNIDISAYNATPSPRNGNFFALDGFMDLPKRLGATEYDWGTSIEPFVDTEDIILDGRTITLNAALKSQYLDAFINACAACTELSIGIGDFPVVQKDEISVAEVGNYKVVSVPFWQNDFVLKPISILPSNSGNFRIDNYDLAKDFGIYISETNNRLNKAKRIDISTTEFYTKTEHRSAWDISLSCSMVGDSLSDLYNKMSQFHAVLMKSGLHALLIRGKSFDVYFKDGLSISELSENYLMFNLKVRSIKEIDFEKYLNVSPNIISWIYPEYFRNVDIESNADWTVE